MAESKEQLTVEWTDTAERQLFEVLDYWTERNKSTTYAEKLTKAIWERTAFLVENPMAAVQTDFPDTRKAAMGYYSILYRVTATGILVTAFWDNRQNPKKLYKLLLSKGSE